MLQNSVSVATSQDTTTRRAGALYQIGSIRSERLPSRSDPTVLPRTTYPRHRPAPRITKAERRPLQRHSAVEHIWHIQDSHGQILVWACG